MTPWPGALTRVRTETGHRYRVILVDDAGWLHARDEAEGTIRAFAPGDHLDLDLTDPDTYRGAVARLALAAGAPAEWVDDGVLFYRDTEGDWAVGCRFVPSSPDLAWSAVFCGTAGLDRIEALRRAMEGA